MDKVIKRIKKEKKINPLKIMAVVFIGLIVIAFILSYISNRDSSFIDEDGGVFVEPTYEVEGVDECKEHCIGYDAHGFDWEGDNCRCWFGIAENVCESQCDSQGADGFDWYEGVFKSDKEYCRCWFEMENPGIDIDFDDGLIWSLFPLMVASIFLLFFLRRVFRY